MKFAAARCLPCRRLIAIGILSPTIHPNPARLLAFGDFAANRGGTPCFERSGWKIRRFCTLIPQIVQNVRFQCKYTAARRVPQLPSGTLRLLQLAFSRSRVRPERGVPACGELMAGERTLLPRLFFCPAPD